MVVFDQAWVQGNSRPLDCDRTFPRGERSQHIVLADTVDSSRTESTSAAKDCAGGAQGELAGRYRLGQVLGTGSTATVHMAEDLLVGRRVAVKLFTRAAVGQDLVEQEQEVRLTSTLRHSALTALLDAGVDSRLAGRSRMFLVLEYMPGADLREQLLDEGAMSVLDVCWLGVDLAAGLGHMHGAGFLHRDIKPSNVLIAAASGVRLRAKLTDFGIASPIGRRESGGTVFGTAAYLSPEQAEGHDPTTASDVYSLGLVLLEALTGIVAFPGTASVAAFSRIVRDPVVPGWIPAHIMELLESMLARIPEQRPGLPVLAEHLRQSAEGHRVFGRHARLAA